MSLELIGELLLLIWGLGLAHKLQRRFNAKINELLAVLGAETRQLRDRIIGRSPLGRMRR
jgi:hypothetical protein